MRISAAPFALAPVRTGSSVDVPRVDARTIDGQVMSTIVPIGEHDPAAGPAVDDARVLRRPVSMSVDHPGDVAAPERVLDRAGVDVEDRFRLARGGGATAAS